MTRKGSSRARPGKRRPRPAGPVLGNDPFLRGAAPREEPRPAPAPAAPEPARATPAEPAPAAPPAGAGSPAPGAPAEGAPSTLAQLGGYAGELAELAGSLLPALLERVRGLGSLLRLGEPAGPLDPFGMDPTLLARAAPLLDFLYLSWWRVEASTASRVPATGPVVVVANHGGALPWDALVLRLALRREHPGRRDLRPLLDAPALQRPVTGPAAIRLGAVPATPENASRLLSEGLAVAVFPEGSAPRPWPQRYRIGAFGRGGFVKLALRAGAAVVPCAIVGSEEASAPVGRAGFLAEALRLPLLGTAPGLPVGPLADLPLPSRWTLRFGDPVDLEGLGPEAAGDAAAVSRLAGRVRETLQAMLDEGLAARRSVFL